MATKAKAQYVSSQPNNDSEGDEETLENNEEDENGDDEQDVKPPNNNVANILKRLESSGALKKAVKQEFRCFTCEIDYTCWEDLEKHLITHVSLPSVILDKLPSDDEDMLSEDGWSDEEDEMPLENNTTPKKIDVLQLLKNTDLVLNKPIQSNRNAAFAFNKLSGLGFTIKKNTTPIKTEKPDGEPVQKTEKDVMQKLGKLGGIKLKLKSDDGNSFKVVNGLKDFKASDDEDDSDQDQGDSSRGDNNESDANDSSGESNTTTLRKKSESDANSVTQKTFTHVPKNDKIVPKSEPDVARKQLIDSEKIKAIARPAVKQTPKRVSNVPIGPKSVQQLTAVPSTSVNETSNNTSAEKTDSQDSNINNVVVKTEIDTGESNAPVPLFSNQIKTERTSSPPIDQVTPIVSTIKTEPETVAQATDYINNTTSNPPAVPLLPVAKKEDVTIIEINGDSNDEDDDCCVVSATPASDVKPVIPKVETVSTPYPTTTFETTSYASSQPSYSTSRLANALSTEKTHSFNWNAPDSKPPIDMLEKSADDIFESLLSSSKKENSSLSEVSEYVSLDSLGSQHSCSVCNTRFTSMSLLEDHRRITGHCSSLVPSSSSSMLPYASNNILSSLLPVKHLAEQVGKLSTIGGSGPGFTHQQNVMINIQAYPGGGGIGGMVPPQPYNPYPPQNPNMHPNFPQAGGNNMYGTSNPYPNQNFGQFQQPMSMPPGPYPTTSAPYSTTTPLQSMQQSVFGQTPGYNNQPQVGQMGPPGISSSIPFIPSSSPGGTMKPPPGSGIKIQNVQTFPPGQLVGGLNSNLPVQGQMSSPGTALGGPMQAPGPIRMAAGATVTGSRPRMPGVRGPRPTIRPGVQVHGQVRNVRPGMRMPIKRTGPTPGGPAQKRRPDMLLPGKHDNEDCQVMAMQKQRDGLPMIQSVQGAKDKLNLGSQISITKKTVNKEANAMANVLASRGISIKQKQKSRSPSPERPLPHIPNLGAGVSIKHTSKSSNFSIPEAKVGGSMMSCKVCKKMFMNQNSLSVHMSSVHPQSKIPVFKCDECPASYPKSLQLQHHKRVFHNVNGPHRELGLPVVDLSQEENLNRLSSLGIYSFIPLANREQANGCFGIPVLSVHNMQNGNTSSLRALGADGLLSLGPLKPLPNN